MDHPLSGIGRDFEVEVKIRDSGMDGQLQLLDKSGIVDPRDQSEQVFARGSSRKQRLVAGSAIFKDPPGLIQVYRAQWHLQQTKAADLHRRVVLASPHRKWLGGGGGNPLALGGWLAHGLRVALINVGVYQLHEVTSNVYRCRKFKSNEIAE